MNTESNSNPIPRYYKWYMLIFLWLAFFLNQGDRQLFNNVLPLIGAPIADGGLGFDKVTLGKVATWFTISTGSSFRSRVSRATRSAKKWSFS